MMKYLLPFLVVQGAYALDGKVVKLQGDVTWVNSPKGAKKISTGDKVPSGAMIKTGAKSFAKMILNDQTALTVGPSSQMELLTQPGGNGGLANMIQGKLRASVTQGDKNGPPKLVVKTPRNSMGVRGTDFRADYNPANGLTSLITFEGAVQMGRFPEGGSGMETFSPGSDSVMVGPGQISTDSPALSEVMEPVVLNPAQLAQLRDNESFSEDGGSAKRFASPIPPGVDGGAFSPSKAEVAKTLGVELGSGKVAPLVSDSGVRQGGFFSDKAGYIAPPANSRIDENTGLPIPSANVGGIDSQGNYLPPAGLALTAEGTFVVESPRVRISLQDIPQVVGAPATTELVTATGQIVPEAPAPGTVVMSEGGTSSGSTTQSSDSLASELADKIVSDAVDSFTDSQNTSTTGATTTTATLAIGSVQ